MRIAITSDLHFRPIWLSRLRSFACRLREAKPDLLIVGGDVGEPLNMFSGGLALLQDVSDVRALVVGNHDVWHREFPHNSRDLWEDRLPAAAEQYGYLWLEEHNLRLGALAICGTIAWYDYSTKPHDIILSDDDYERIKPMLSNDGNYIDWDWSDRQFAAKVGRAFEERLDRLEHDEEITDIVVISHVPLFRECLRPATMPEERILNAYYGNLPLGEVVQASKKVRAIFSGHVHHEKRLSIPRSGADPLAVYTIPADYGMPAALLLDTETWEVTRIPPVGASDAPDCG
ncbi:MAG: metallophosphoesterase [Anaerolineae bacterium]